MVPCAGRLCGCRAQEGDVNVRHRYDAYLSLSSDLRMNVIDIDKAGSETVH